MGIRVWTKDGVEFALGMTLWDVELYGDNMLCGSALRKITTSEADHELWNNQGKYMPGYHNAQNPVYVKHKFHTHWVWEVSTLYHHKRNAVNVIIAAIDEEIKCLSEEKQRLLLDSG